MKTKPDLLLETVRDAVADMLYHERKHDEELSREDVGRLCRDGLVTIDMLTEAFRKALADSGYFPAR